MTEKNMRKLYEHFVESGQSEKAEEILNIPRYAHFKEEPVEVDSKKSKKVK